MARVPGVGSGASGHVVVVLVSSGECIPSPGFILSLSLPCLTSALHFSCRRAGRNVQWTTLLRSG
uniref:Uncharacterized protein n=1 Tax=Triticum urartu TaxID=4572 RepID=A0A8R7Q9K5_TRIUA